MVGNSISMFKIFDNITTVSKHEETHTLSYEWNFWHHLRKPKTSSANPDSGNINTNSGTNSIPKLDDENCHRPLERYLQGMSLMEFPQIYGQGAEKTSKIDTIEQYWEALVNLKDISKLEIDTELYLFKKDIKPLWEDEKNLNGGRWVACFGLKNFADNSAWLSSLWELLSLKLISGQFISTEISLPLSEKLIDNPAFDNCKSSKVMSNEELNKMVIEDIAGLAVSVRNKKILISIWNTNLAYEEYKKLNGIIETVKSEEYMSYFKEPVYTGNRSNYEKCGLTRILFRKLIYQTIVDTMDEVTKRLAAKEGKNKVKPLAPMLFKYCTHQQDLFNENYRKPTNRTGKNKSLGDDKQPKKTCKTVEYGEYDLVIEEITCNAQKSRRNRRRQASNKAFEGAESEDVNIIDRDAKV